MLEWRSRNLRRKRLVDFAGSAAKILISAKEKKAVRLTFCAYKEDLLGAKALGYLMEIGCETILLEDGQTAPEMSVALFSPSLELKWTGRWSAVVAHRLADAAPAWAATTPFLAALREGAGLQAAVLHLAKMYEHWLADKKGIGCPWSCEPTDEHVLVVFREWQERAHGVLPKAVWEKTPGLWPPKKKRPPRVRGQSYGFR